MKKNPRSPLIIFLWLLLFSQIGIFGEFYTIDQLTENEWLLDAVYRQYLTNLSGLPDLYWEWSPQPRWLGGQNWGGSTFYGSLDRGGNFFGSTLADTEYVEVEIRFDSNDTTLCQTYRRDLSYNAAGVGVFRGSAWDISDPNNPRRLNICFVEDNAQKPANQLWDPDTTSAGGREYLFIMLSDYDGTGTTYNNSNWGPAADVVYAWWPRLEPGHPFFETDPASLSIKFAYIRHFRAIPDDGKLILSWTFDEPGADHLNLYWGTSSPPNNLLASLSTTDQIYEHLGLINQSSYFYRMEAINATGEVLHVSKEISAEPQIVSQNVNLLGFWHQRRSYGDIWGYTDQSTGREYALMCARIDGLSIIDITDPIPVEVGFAPAIGPGVDSKDVKVYSHYAILINEGAPAQIFDISDPANPNQVSIIDYSTLGYSGGAHNCYVEGDYLYIVGNHGPGGLLIYEISNPSSPNFAGSFEPYYYHDVYVRNDTAYAAAIYGQGVDIIDLSNKIQPSLITTFNYPGSGAHNCWTTEDGDYIFVGDEIGSSGRWTRVFDIRDFSNITQVADIIVDPNAVTHNSYVRGDILYIGHYTEGVRFVDVSDPTSPQEIGYYDTYIPQEYGFRGCWSVYPYFQSGKVIASDMQTGLYVLQLDSTVLKTGAAGPPLPQEFYLGQNYPNPFNPTTRFEFGIPDHGFVSLKVYDALGKEIATLINERFAPGAHTAQWNAEKSASGIYYYKLTFVGDNGGQQYERTRKMILLK